MNQDSALEQLPLPEAGANEQDEEGQSADERRIWSRLPQLLRWIGGLSLAGSAITFLLGGWMDAAPLIRYYSFFALTSALTLAGVFCGLKLKEDKGARTFLSLGTAFIPVLFCQLGAIVYAQIKGTTSQFPEYFEVFQFSPIGTSLLILTLVAAFVLLTAYAFFGFSAMARPAAKKLTALYLLANTALLVPLRDELTVASMGFVLLGLLAYFDRKTFSKSSVLRTWDGRAMRSLLFVPFGLLLLRSVLLYETSNLLVALFSASIATLFFFGLPQATNSVAWKRFYQHLSLPPLAVACISIGFPIADRIRIFGTDSYFLLLVMPSALLVILLSHRTRESGRSFRFIATATAISVATLQMANVDGLFTALTSLLVAIGCTIYSYTIREKIVLFMGLAGTGLSLAYHVSYAAELYRNNLWLSLAATGVAVILAASYVERNWQTLLAQGKGFRRKLDDWN
ncbi:hypothetical protein IEN85_01385 [Pelagicoccus sp. NFK12]|uniref:DUF2157 domain-containing protein n=1 Tax=Pelagicoccus enzymogenes TaxID=2773457 RepID=A0A927F4T0_9BACT|nr:hypothetical protein [Pelagicoccus enzymogenes]MBD5778147.1 hypothetical protein [Pelagicoccus enzymogenes]MDQ8198096.1 hypothetical protein [Pelagicoccus enzymogenes]